MAELKTEKNQASVHEFLGRIEPPQKRADALAITAMMQEITGAEPQMWGASIIGFGEYTYQYASGRKGEWMLVGFSPRKQNLTLYIMAGFDRYEALLAQLGKYKTGKACLYLKKLADVDEMILRTLIAESVEHMKAAHPNI